MSKDRQEHEEVLRRLLFQRPRDCMRSNLMTAPWLRKMPLFAQRILTAPLAQPTTHNSGKCSLKSDITSSL
jgi:hypothetical protein